MAFTSTNSLLPTKPFQTQQSFSHSSKPMFSSIPISNRSLHSVSVVHSPESSKPPIIPSATASSTQTLTTVSATDQIVGTNKGGGGGDGGIR
ncbi:hypothetical protein LguiA_012523 [Lonicera macranthoides]